MNSTEINQALDHIRAKAAKNDKILLLKHYLEDQDFLWVIQQMLDPRIRFGIADKTIKKVMETTHIGTPHTWETSPIDVVMTLGDLATRGLTGSAAEDRLHMLCGNLEPDSWHLLTRVLKKEPDAGFSESSVNKARPNTVWTFDCMLAHNFEEKRVPSWPMVAEPKIDGVRCLIMVQPTKYTAPDIGFFSRSGKEFTTFDAIADDIGTLCLMTPSFLSKSWIIDCEIDSGSFNETVSQARRSSEQASDAVARCFDILTQEDWENGKSANPFQARRTILEIFAGVPAKTKRVQVIEQRLVNSVDEVMAFNGEIQAAGGEGLIVKPENHIYECKRSYSWLKIKAFETHDLVITGFFEGKGKYKGSLGGVIVDLDGVAVRVGGGFTDADRQLIWTNQADYLGRMIEVGAHEKTPDGSFRHPRFMRWRDDKQKAAA